MNRGPYSMAAHGLDTRGDARRAEDAWLASQDEKRSNRPRLPDPWGHDKETR